MSKPLTVAEILAEIKRRLDDNSPNNEAYWELRDFEEWIDQRCETDSFKFATIGECMIDQAPGTIAVRRDPWVSKAYFVPYFKLNGNWHGIMYYLVGLPDWEYYSDEELGYVVTLRNNQHDKINGCGNIGGD